MDALLGWLTQARWSPYAAGIGIGLLSCLAFVLSDKAIGCSTAFARASGMIERLFRGDRVLERPYYKQFPPVVDWEWMLVAGAVLGSFASAALSGDLSPEWVPQRWADAFGPARGPRLLTALAGGVFMGLGARWAGGCTSGHGISGTLQLAASSWVAALAFFVGGVGTALALTRVFL